jgi:hypothetical protein
MLSGAAVTALTRTSVCALARHPQGPRTASDASSSHIGRSEERSHPRLHRLPIDDQAATAKSSGLMTNSSPPPLRSLREIVPLPTIKHKPGASRFPPTICAGFLLGYRLVTGDSQPSGCEPYTATSRRAARPASDRLDHSRAAVYRPRHRRSAVAPYANTRPHLTKTMGVTPPWERSVFGPIGASV